MDEFELKGIWWFPQIPDDKVTGILKFHPIEGAVLETLGDTFSTQIGKLVKIGKGFIYSEANLVIDFICGISSQGENITLWKCLVSGGSLAGGYESARFIINTIFKGRHFETDSDLIFDRIAINYSHLERWLKTSGFTIKYERSETGRVVGFDLSYKNTSNTSNSS